MSALRDQLIRVLVYFRFASIAVANYHMSRRDARATIPDFKFSVCALRWSGGVVYYIETYRNLGPAITLLACGA